MNETEPSWPADPSVGHMVTHWVDLNITGVDFDDDDQMDKICTCGLDDLGWSSTEGQVMATAHALVHEDVGSSDVIRIQLALAKATGLRIQAVFPGTHWSLSDTGQYPEGGISPREVTRVAQELHDYATHFSDERDWNYTRDKGDLVAIRYADDYDRAWSRFKRAVRYLVHGYGKSDLTVSRWDTVSRWGMIRHTCLRRDPHLPDGVLDGGNIITHWEETGEYLQYVQPTVGEMISKWLMAEPDNPHARAVAGEMLRIQNRYTERFANARRDNPKEYGDEEENHG